MIVGATSLRQLDPDALRSPESEGLGTRLVQQISPRPGLAQFLYGRIGRPHGWSSRSGWNDGQWTEWLSRPDRELWLSWQHGQLTGFAELWLGHSADRTATYVKFLGLLPEHCGLGLGGHLVAQVTRRAWTAHHRVPWLPRVEAVCVDTAELDDPRALPNYKARGFSVVDERREDPTVDLAAPRPGSATTSP